MALPDGYFLGKVRGCLPDAVWMAVERLAKIVLVLAFLCLPVALASLHEMETTQDVHPSGDCVSLVAGDGGDHGGRVFCFARDFFSQWGDKFVVFLTLVAVDCEPVSDYQAKKECDDRRRWRIEKLVQHSVILLVGIFVI